MSSEKTEKIQNKRRDRINFILSQDQRTQKELAIALGVTESYLSDVKRGRDPVTVGVAKKFQVVFGVQAEWILHGTGPLRIAEDGPQYMAGALSEPAPPHLSAVVRSRTAYHCSACLGEVTLAVHYCCHCGAYLEWLGQEGKGKTDD